MRMRTGPFVSVVVWTIVVLTGPWVAERTGVAEEQHPFTGAGPIAWVGDLTPISPDEWSYDRAAHLLERAGFGGTPAEVQRLASMTPTEAVDDLVQRGYTVIRLGDPSMTPLRHPGVVDLATSPTRTNLLEVYCLLRSDFIIEFFRKISNSNRFLS